MPPRGPERARRALVAAACALFAGVAAAGPWPERPAHLVVPVAAGGHPDVVARALAQELAKRLRQPVLVENQPGAQTNIGMQNVARAAPDGYTYLLALTSLVINPWLSKLAFDPLRDFAPVALLSRSQFLLAASPKLPAATAEELISLARGRAGRLNCAHAGGATQLACVLFAELTGATLAQVPYRGSALALADLARGDVDLQFLNVAAAAPHVRNGRIRALGLTDPALGSEPLERLPALGTLLPGFEIGGWLGVVAPTGTPAPVLTRMSHEIAEAIATPELASVLARDGVPVVHASRKEFGAFLRREHARYGRMIERAGLRAD